MVLLENLKRRTWNNNMMALDSEIRAMVQTLNAALNVVHSMYRKGFQNQNLYLLFQNSKKNLKALSSQELLDSVQTILSRCIARRVTSQVRVQPDRATNLVPIAL